MVSGVIIQIGRLGLSWISHQSMLTIQLRYVSEPMMAIMTMEENGDLQNYLQETRAQMYANMSSRLDLTGMAWDVSKGLAYLSVLQVPSAQRVTK